LLIKNIGELPIPGNAYLNSDKPEDLKVDHPSALV
jgi:hypothetical protein